jgi:tellurite resistance protein TerC
VFIGVKMLLYDVVHMPVWVSLVVIAAVGGGAVAASLWRDRRRHAVAPDREGDAGDAVAPDRDRDDAGVRDEACVRDGACVRDRAGSRDGAGFRDGDAGDGVSADHGMRGTVRT